MINGINPAQMQSVMKKMGISQTPLDVHRVIFEMEGTRLVIDEPSVTKVVMQGTETYQVAGEAREETDELFSKADVQTVVEKTGKSEEEVKKFLAEHEGDIALAILELSK